MSTTHPEGWFPDPLHRHEHRYWDGNTWTEHVATGGVRSVDPVQSTPVPAAAAQTGAAAAVPTPTADALPAAARAGAAKRRSRSMIVALVAVAVLAAGAVLVVENTGGGDGSSANFCSDAHALAAHHPGLVSGSFDASDGAEVRQVGKELRKLADEAPAAIRRDLSTWADAWSQIADGQTPSISARESNGVEERLQAWADEHPGCGLDG